MPAWAAANVSCTFDLPSAGLPSRWRNITLLVASKIGTTACLDFGSLRCRNRSERLNRSSDGFFLQPRGRRDHVPPAEMIAKSSISRIKYVSLLTMRRRVPSATRMNRPIRLPSRPLQGRSRSPSAVSRKSEPEQDAVIGRSHRGPVPARASEWPRQSDGSALRPRGSRPGQSPRSLLTLRALQSLMPGAGRWYDRRHH